MGLHRRRPRSRQILVQLPQGQPDRPTHQPLDDINATTWPAEWNGELIDLLSVLSRLVELEPAQADLLNAIIAQPVASYADLAAAGVTWPGPNANDMQRSPNYAEADQDQQAEDEAGQLGFAFGGN